MGGTGPSTGSPGTSSRRASFKVPEELAREARNAIFWLREQGNHEVTLASLIESAVREHLDRLKREHNQGRDFPDRHGRLPPGRRLSGS